MKLWLASVLCNMQVVFPTELDEQNMTFDASSDMKRIGGPITLEAAAEQQQQQQQVTVQVYVDHSAVEVFLSSGEALATRCNKLPLIYTCMHTCHCSPDYL